MSFKVKLLHAIKKNNRYLIDNVFESIYYEYSKLIGYVISKYVTRKEDVEELINDVFVSFYSAAIKIEIKNIKYYLLKSAKTHWWIFSVKIK